MKIAPFVHAIAAHNKSPVRSPDVLIEHYLVHTGQHYDAKMSESFFDALRIPFPDTNLEIGSGTHAEQVGNTMIAFEKVVREWQPDWVVVVGDVNATCACSITAKKEWVRLAHIEAGLRSFDLKMPEEINRMVTDRLSDLLFTPDKMSDANLLREGTAKEKIICVGNIMVDTLEANKAEAEKLDIATVVANNLIPGHCEPNIASGTTGCDPATLGPKNYALLTLHRPSNVDREQDLRPLSEYLISELSSELPLVWSIHPRARKQLEKFGLWGAVVACPGIVVVHPLSYHEMLRMSMGARVVLTDSGGIQEECCVLGTPCLTLRENTERPITLQENGGVSILTGSDIDRIREAFRQVGQPGLPHSCPPLWDGNTAGRIVKALAATLHNV